MNSNLKISESNTEINYKDENNDNFSKNNNKYNSLLSGNSQLSTIVLENSNYHTNKKESFTHTEDINGILNINSNIDTNIFNINKAYKENTLVHHNNSTSNYNVINNAKIKTNDIVFENNSPSRFDETRNYNNSKNKTNNISNINSNYSKITISPLKANKAKIANNKVLKQNSSLVISKFSSSPLLSEEKIKVTESSNYNINSNYYNLNGYKRQNSSITGKYGNNNVLKKQKYKTLSLNALNILKNNSISDVSENNYINKNYKNSFTNNSIHSAVNNSNNNSNNIVHDFSMKYKLLNLNSNTEKSSKLLQDIEKQSQVLGDIIKSKSTSKQILLDTGKEIAYNNRNKNNKTNNNKELANCFFKEILNGLLKRDDTEISNNNSKSNNDIANNNAINNIEATPYLIEDHYSKFLSQLSKKEVIETFDNIYTKNLLSIFKIPASFGNNSTRQSKSEMGILKRLEDFMTNIDNRKLVEMKEIVYFLKGLIDYSLPKLKTFELNIEKKNIKQLAEKNKVLNKNKRLFSQGVIDKQLSRFKNERYEDDDYAIDDCCCKRVNSSISYSNNRSNKNNDAYNKDTNKNNYLNIKDVCITNSSNISNIELSNNSNNTRTSNKSKNKNPGECKNTSAKNAKQEGLKKYNFLIKNLKTNNTIITNNINSIDSISRINKVLKDKNVTKNNKIKKDYLEYLQEQDFQKIKELNKLNKRSIEEISRRSPKLIYKADSSKISNYLNKVFKYDNNNYSRIDNSSKNIRLSSNNIKNSDKNYRNNVYINKDKENDDFTFNNKILHIKNNSNLISLNLNKNIKSENDKDEREFSSKRILNNNNKIKQILNNNAKHNNSRKEEYIKCNKSKVSVEYYSNNINNEINNAQKSIHNSNAFISSANVILNPKYNEVINDLKIDTTQSLNNISQNYKNINNSSNKIKIEVKKNSSQVINSLLNTRVLKKNSDNNIKKYSNINNIRNSINFFDKDLLIEKVDFSLIKNKRIKDDNENIKSDWLENNILGEYKKYVSKRSKNNNNISNTNDKFKLNSKISSDYNSRSIDPNRFLINKLIN